MANKIEANRFSLSPRELVYDHPVVAGAVGTTVAVLVSSVIAEILGFHELSGIIIAFFVIMVSFSIVFLYIPYLVYERFGK